MLMSCRTKDLKPKGTKEGVFLQIPVTRPDPYNYMDAEQNPTGYHEAYASSSVPVPLSPRMNFP